MRLGGRARDRSACSLSRRVAEVSDLYDALLDAWNRRDAAAYAALFSEDGHWQIFQFQNTPAQFHGRPEMAEALTDELRLLF
jgi:uncharacterized protein (TIGR02246 family)